MRKQKKDAATLALMMAVLGVVLLFWGQNLRLGTARHMGPGFMPMLIAGMAFALAAILAGKAFLAGRDEAATDKPAEGVNWGALVGISFGILAFALLIRPAGLLVASAVAVLSASLAQRYSGVVERLLLAGGLTAAAALVFVEGLALPFRLFPGL